MLSDGNDQSAPSGLEDARKVLDLKLDSDEDPLVMLHRLTESTDKKGAVENESLIQSQDEKSSFQEMEMFLYEDNDSYFTPAVDATGRRRSSGFSQFNRSGILSFHGGVCRGIVCSATTQGADKVSSSQSRQ